MTTLVSDKTSRTPVLCKMCKSLLNGQKRRPEEGKCSGFVERWDCELCRAAPGISTNEHGLDVLVSGAGSSLPRLIIVPSIMDVVQRNIKVRILGSDGHSTPRATRTDAREEEGYLTCRRIDREHKEEDVFFPRIVSPRFDPKIVKEWLAACRKYHWCTSEPWGRSETVPDVNLIDCQTRSIVTASGSSFPSSMPPFVALSYVWGAQPKTTTSHRPAEGSEPSGGNGRLLPKAMPAVIEDAIQVTQALGFRYIWVDKYCIDQTDDTKKHRQISHMDSVYSNAALTIIAAASNDETVGLPGVSAPRPFRQQQQVSIQTKTLRLVSTLPHPQQQIVSSRWATRAWTYQEAILSPRRLVFAASQLYFECDAMHCYESMGVSFDMLYQSRIAACRDFVRRPRLFGFENLAGEVLFIECAEAYSRRSLTYDDDALDAFFGVTRRLEKVSDPPVRHVAGVPFLHPRPDVDSLRMLMIGLSWRHEGGKQASSSFSSCPRRRRRKFPSWSWVGWAGPVVWPSRGSCRCFWHYRYSEIRRDCPARDDDDHAHRGARARGQSQDGIPISCARAVRLELDDGTTHSIWELPFDREDDLSIRRPRALILDTVAMSRDEVVLDEDEDEDEGEASCGGLRLRSGQGKLDFFPSQDGLGPSETVDGIRCGRYEGILLCAVDDDVWVLLVESCGGGGSSKSYSRIGIMRVQKPPGQLFHASSGLRTFRLI